MSGLKPEAVAAYLDRIGVATPVKPDGDTLRQLHSAHLRTVPFENLSIHLGEPISLEMSALFAKLVTQRRGGFCYELNGMFALLLEALGYRVRRMSARTFNAEHGYSPPMDHLVLRVVDAASDVWLVDVGFGRHTEFPLRFDDRGVQVDPGGLFEVDETDGGEFLVLREGEVQYRFDPRPLALSDFSMACWWQQTSPDSHFARSLVCSRLTEGGRVTLSGRKLVTTDASGRVESELGDDDAVLEAYRDLFGIKLKRVPALKRRA